MVQYSERNSYADHLVEINKTNPVITTQDICNSLGATVIPKGTNITEDVANKISRFKLDLPIELQVNLTVTLSPNELFNDIRLAQKNTFGKDGGSETTKELIRQCGLLNAYPLISQKLTVFEERMPKKYTDTQSATGFAILIAQQLGLKDEAIELVFAAAQMHDAGFLNIDPEAALSVDQLPESEKRALYKEQLLLGKEFLDKVPNLSKRVGDTILAYNERKDGSGWPRGIIGDKNSIESQIVGLAVMLNEAYSNTLKPRGYCSGHLLPVIQVESEGINIDVYNAAVEMLRKGAVATSLVIPIEFMPPLAKYLIVLQRFLVHWLMLAKACSSEMQKIKSIEDTERSTTMIASLEQLYQNSGIWEPDIRTWLSEVAIKGQENEFIEVETIALMFESVMQKLKCLQWSMRESAKRIGHEWVARCDDLANLLYGLPNDHFEAFEKYPCFDDG